MWLHNTHIINEYKTIASEVTEQLNLTFRKMFQVKDITYDLRDFEYFTSTKV